MHNAHVCVYKQEISCAACTDHFPFMHNEHILCKSLLVVQTFSKSLGECVSSESAHSTVITALPSRPVIENLIQ